MKAQNCRIKSLQDNTLHRTASLNEYSTRYSIAIDSQNSTEPNEWRLQSATNKQGSAGELVEWTDDWKDGMDPHSVGEIIQDYSPGSWLSAREEFVYEHARGLYNEALALGVAREQARKVLPLSTMTEVYWKIDLHNLGHFLRLRLDSHAQQEIRDFADALKAIIDQWVPLTAQAFDDYRFGASNFSASEKKILASILAQFKGTPEMKELIATHLPNKREADEFRKKIGFIQ